MYEELIEKQEKKLSGLSDKVSGLQSLHLPTLFTALEERNAKKMQEVEIENEIDRQTISKLAKAEADMMKELIEVVEENDRTEIDKLLSNGEI